MDGPLAPPRYRIEHRQPDLSPLVVAFADTLRAAHLAVATERTARGAGGGTGAGDLVIVDQETETDVKALPIAR
jgi:hypothetical protein